MNQKAFITGGGGDVAQAIAARFRFYTAPDRFDMDVTDNEAVERLMAAVKPDVLINCAGYIKPSLVSESDPEEWRKQIEVNLLGTYYCARAALKNGVQTIINIASSSGFYGRPTWSAYCASKAGVISFTQSLAEEGVNAFCISPHRIDTKMRGELFKNEDKGTLMPPSKIADVVEEILLGKYQKGDNIEVSYDEIKVRN